MTETPNEGTIQPPAPKQKSRARRWIGRLIKISIVLALVVFGLLTVLSRIGGNSDVLKQAIEDFLNDATPYTSQIGTLNGMHFFPDIVIDVSNIDLRSQEDPTAESPIRVGSAKLVMPFFDVMFRPGRFKDIQITDLQAQPGALAQVPVNIKSLSIQETIETSETSEEGQPQGPALVLEGTIGSSPLTAHIGLSASGEASGRVYSIGNQRTFKTTLGPVNAEGTLKNTITGTIKLENLTLAHGNQKALRGNFDIDRIDGGVFIKGQARLEPGQSMVTERMKIEWGEPDAPLKISGELSSEMLLLSDVIENASFLKVKDDLEKIITGEADDRISFEDTLDLNIDIKNLTHKGITLGDVSTPVKTLDGALEIGPLAGKIIDGALAGTLTIKPDQNTSKLQTKITIKGFDYGALQRQFVETAEIDGKADILIDLKSQGQNIDALMDGLSGKLSFVSGKGTMRSGILNLWGGGLLDALLPKLGNNENLDVNCVVANMDLENLKGHSDAIFVDTQHVILQGEGTYDFKKDRLEMVLQPKTKTVAIGDISAAVNVSGPLDDLKVSPNLFDLSKRVGGLLLGAVNPAFYALTLTDLGLQDNHPCKAYVIEKETLPEPVFQKSSETPDVQENPPNKAEDPEGNP